MLLGAFRPQTTTEDKKVTDSERTRISCHAALDKAACAPFSKERRMMFVSATNFYWKSGVAQWRDLRFSFCSNADSLSL
jgi:hypothetical protein